MTIKELKEVLDKYDENRELTFVFAYQRHKCIPGAIEKFESIHKNPLVISDSITGKVEIYNQCELSREETLH